MRNYGFTLIEALIYITLISIMIVVSISALNTLIDNSAGLNDRVTIEDEANFLLKKIEWALSSLESITLPAEGGSGSSLIINRYNFASNPVAFDLNSGNLRMAVGGGAPVILNSDLVVVEDLSFENLAPAGKKPPGITASFSINDKIFSITLYKNQ